MGVSKHTVGHPNIWGCPNKWEHPNIQGVHPSILGHPNVWAYGHPLSLRKHAFFLLYMCGGIQMYGAYGHPLSLTKHAFFVLYMYKGHPNIIQTYGGVQAYRWYPNIGGHPSIQGHPTYGGVQTYREAYGGIQTYWGHPNMGHPNIQGTSKHMGASKCMGHMDTPLV